MENETVCVSALDSVLQKAEELENNLRRWRVRLCTASSTPSDTIQDDIFYSGIATTTTGDQSSSSNTTATTSVVEQHGDNDDDEGRGKKMDSAWHQLTSYIVQLEKKVKKMEEKKTQSTVMIGINDGFTKTSEVVKKTGMSANSQVEYKSRHCKALLLVFSWLTTTELCIVSQVCREWYGISHDPRLWRTMRLSETVLTSQDLVNIGRWCGNTNTIILHGLMPEMAGPDEELHSYIARQRGSLESGLARLLSSAPQLTSLSVTECNLMITERLLWLCSVHCTQLQQLTYTSDEFPPTPAALWALSNGCPHLQSLHLPPYLTSPFCNYFNDFCLSAIAKGWPHLLQLTVGGSGITAVGLTEIVHYCPWLEVLNVEYGPQLSSSDVKDMTTGGGLTNLQHLTLSFTPISPRALNQLTAVCSKLSSLTLHISPNTYFPGTSADSTILKKYDQIHSNFQDLQQTPQLKGIFHLHHHPLTTDTVI